MTMTQQQNRIAGVFYGQALGDAMGMPSELWPRARIRQHFGWIDRFLPGPAENSAACYFGQAVFTDDTAMALALAEAIISHNGTIHPETIAANILRWAASFDAFNKNILGPTSKAALTALKNGTPLAQLMNNGTTNGAAMRASPLGCLLPTRDLDAFIDAVALASSPTHKADAAIAGATSIAWAVSRAIDGAGWASIRDELPAVALAAQKKGVMTFSASVSARIELALQVVAQGRGVKSTMQQIYDLVGTGTGTAESVPAAIAMVELAATDPNRCAILCANLGGDTDTIGAMAVAICGALHGIDGIESSLIAELDRANSGTVDFARYSESFLRFRQQREAAYDRA